MNELITSDGVLTMSSREIADLTGKRHDNVMRDTRAMLVELHGEADLLRFEGVYSGGNGEDRPCFNLPKRETLILVSGYSVKLRARIIDRWQELEARPAPMSPVNMSRLQLIELAMQAEQERLALAVENEAMRPKVEAFERIAEADGSLCVTGAAKGLQMRPKDLFRWLAENRWIYRRAGGAGWLAYQERLQAGLLEHKVTTVERGDGTSKVVEQVRITPKGLARLAREVRPRAA